MVSLRLSFISDQTRHIMKYHHPIVLKRSPTFIKGADSPSNATLKMFGQDEGDVIHEMIFTSTTGLKVVD